MYNSTTGDAIYIQLAYAVLGATSASSKSTGHAIMGNIMNKWEAQA